MMQRIKQEKDQGTEEFQEAKINVQDYNLKSKGKSLKKATSSMIPQNTNSHFAFFLLPLPCCFAPYPSESSLQTISKFPDMKVPVKLEEDDSRRFTYVEASSPSSNINESPANQAPLTVATSRNGSGKKIFKKDRRCPAQGCRRKYSSRIALRAHIRKEHPGWYEDTSDYEP